MKICPKCNKDHKKPGKFCSRTCANSRGPRTNDFKNQVRLKLKGVPLKTETVEKMKSAKSHKLKLIKKCPICGNIFQTNYKTCSRVCRNALIGENSHKNENCGGARRSKRYICKNIADQQFILDSSYELQFATILNKKNLLWVKPKSFLYVDATGKTRRYHPDFYVPLLNEYFDPKNDYLAAKDALKIRLVSEQNQIKITILRLADILNWDIPLNN